MQDFNHRIPQERKVVTPIPWPAQPGTRGAARARARPWPRAGLAHVHRGR